jgi:hypothetical protein
MNGNCIFSEDGRTEDEWTPYIFGGLMDGGRADTIYFRRTDGHSIFSEDGGWRTNGGRQWFSTG